MSASFVPIKPFDGEVWNVRKDAIIAYKIEVHIQDGERYLLTLWVMGVEDCTMLVMEDEDLMIAMDKIDSEAIIPALSPPENEENNIEDMVEIRE